MIDGPVRRMLETPLTRIAAMIDVPWVTPDRLTVAGLIVGLASAGAAAAQLWPLAVTLWLMSRVVDGLDGSLARLRRRRAAASADPASETHRASETESRDDTLRPNAAHSPSEAGGYLDIVCDFAVYGATVVGVGLGVTAQFGAPWLPFVLVLLAYYVNGAAFLAFSSIAERSGRTLDDGRSLSFLGRIAEGTETIVVHALWMLLPTFAWQLATAWSVFVAVSAVQRIVVGYRALR